MTADKKPDSCKATVSHINRIQGQMNTLKAFIEDGKCCKDVIHMAISIVKSFDSLRARIVEGYICESFMKGKKLTKCEEEEMKNLFSLIKA